MDTKNVRVSRYFLALIFCQIVHSIEEIWFSLWAVFAPARFVASLFSRDPATGFLLGNIAVILFGVWCYVARVRPIHVSAQGWVMFWVVLEMVNGTGHLFMALARGTYMPGVVTAPLLIISSLLLARAQIRKR